MHRRLTAATNSLLDLDRLVNLHIDNNDYSNVPSGQIWIHYAWSGDMAAAAGYMPKGTPVDVIGYWFPSDGKGPVGNDTMTVLAGGKNPVLAHLFLNYMLDLPNVFENISYNGYMQPINGVTPEVAGPEGNLSPQPDVDRRSALLLRQRPPGTAAGPGCRRPMAAGLATGQRRRLSGG